LLLYKKLDGSSNKKENTIAVKAFWFFFFSNYLVELLRVPKKLSLIDIGLKTLYLTKVVNNCNFLPKGRQ